MSKFPEIELPTCSYAWLSTSLAEADQLEEDAHGLSGLSSLDRNLTLFMDHETAEEVALSEALQRQELGYGLMEISLGRAARQEINNTVIVAREELSKLAIHSFMKYETSGVTIRTWFA